MVDAEIIYYPCPFFGFVKDGRILREDNLPICGFVGTRLCLLAICKMTPDWRRRGFNNKNNAEKLGDWFENGKVIAEKFRPPGCDNWGGMSFADWFNFVMKNNQKTKPAIKKLPKQISPSKIDGLSI